ncbi:MAG: hypothetical protein IH987_18420 [Planctomycetes bacterium]|nr:hypothetical protein [Planctomycetota bacterium]
MLAFRQVSRRLNALRMNLTLFAIGSLLVAVPAWGQPRALKKGEVVKLAPAITPNIYMATAVDQDGKVVIRVSALEIRIRNTARDDKDAKGWITCWTEQDPLILGRQIRAYNPSGKKIDDRAVLKALAKPVAVACFQRKHKDDPELPDPFYAGVFRDDLVILVFEAKYWLR